jgi:hypothetical protein
MTERRPMYTYQDGVEAAEAMVVLSEMAIERGVTRIADLGDLPPLDPATKAKYLARARARYLAETEKIHNDDE